MFENSVPYSDSHDNLCTNIFAVQKTFFSNDYFWVIFIWTKNSVSGEKIFPDFE